MKSILLQDGLNSSELINTRDVQEFRLPFKSLIGGWTIPEDVCDDLIKHHKFSNEKIEGQQIYNNKPEVNKLVKESTDVYIDPEQFFQTKYITKYVCYLKECLHQYKNKYPPSKDVPIHGINESVNIQHYKPKGGFKAWHFENGQPNKINRYLVFMTYLNNVKDGGTEFFYQKLRIPALKGLTVIWPAYWTHVHKGEISKINEKYIITGWFNFYDQN